MVMSFATSSIIFVYMNLQYKHLTRKTNAAYLQHLSVLEHRLTGMINSKKLFHNLYKAASK